MFTPVWTREAAQTYEELRARVQASLRARGKSRSTKSTRDEGLFKQVHKCITHLLADPRHPSLQTHVYHSLPNPYDKRQKVFEAYVQSKTPGAYRVFWCYGPGKRELTIIAITPHP
jgi:hypothetical protein